MLATIGVCQVQKDNHDQINSYSACAQLILPFCCSQACIIQLLNSYSACARLILPFCCSQACIVQVLLAVQTVVSNNHVIDVEHVSSVCVPNQHSHVKQSCQTVMSATWEVPGGQGLAWAAAGVAPPCWSHCCPLPLPGTPQQSVRCQAGCCFVRCQLSYLLHAR